MSENNGSIWRRRKWRLFKKLLAELYGNSGNIVELETGFGKLHVLLVGDGGKIVNNGCVLNRVPDSENYCVSVLVGPPEKGGITIRPEAISTKEVAVKTELPASPSIVDNGKPPEEIDLEQEIVLQPLFPPPHQPEEFGVLLPPHPPTIISDIEEEVDLDDLRR